MKVLFSDNTLWGLLKFRRDVILHCLSCGYEVVLVAPFDRLEGKEALPQGVKYVPIKMDRTSVNPFKDLLYCIRLFKIYYSERPDYIFHYTIKPNVYGSIVAKVLKIPSCAIIAGLGHVFTNSNISSRIARTLYRFALRYPIKVFVLNKSNEQILLNKNFIQKNRLVLLSGGEGVNLSIYRQQPYPHNDKIRFLMVARILYDKGYREYVEVAKSLHDQADFYIMGALDFNPSGVPKMIVEQDIKNGYIKHIKFSDDVIDHMKFADCIVLPSYHEGLSRVLMEALALGRPIICSDISGCRETVNDGVNGFLCQPKSVDSLKSVCVKFLSLSYEDRALMGVKGRRLAEQVFDNKFVVEKYDALLRK